MEEMQWKNKDLLQKKVNYLPTPLLGNCESKDKISRAGGESTQLQPALPVATQEPPAPLQGSAHMRLSKRHERFQVGSRSHREQTAKPRFESRIPWPPSLTARRIVPDSRGLIEDCNRLSPFPTGSNLAEVVPCMLYEY
ncbi:uncharacterized protein ACIBXB_009541 isoform 1-T1 [Morphnus guianensis]